MKLHVLLILSLTFLSSCTTTGLFKRLDVNTVEKARPTLQLTQPVPLNLQNPKYYVITPDNANAIFEEMKKEGIEPVIIGTSVEGFSVIVTNNVKLQQLIQKYQSDVAAQQKYYSTPIN